MLKVKTPDWGKGLAESLFVQFNHYMMSISLSPGVGIRYERTI